MGKKDRYVTPDTIPVTFTAREVDRETGKTVREGVGFTSKEAIENMEDDDEDEEE